jgi:hypothetical protein
LCRRIFAEKCEKEVAAAASASRASPWTFSVVYLSPETIRAAAEIG